MDEHPHLSEGHSSPAWQPFTFRGAAGFASASFARLIAVAFAAAALIAVATAACLYWTWGPALDEAVARLPPTGEIRHGRLVWPETAPTPLVDNQFLAILVRRGDAPKPGQSADVQVELGESAATLSSLLGFVVVAYPEGSILPLNRTELEPLWGAWRPYLHVGTALVVAGGLLVLWSLLAAALVLPVRFYAFLANRRTTCAACWRVAVACLLPGAILMGLAILFYGLRRLTLVDLLLINGVHLVVGLVYLLIVPLRLPRHGSPFGPPADQPTSSSNLAPVPVAPAPPPAPAIGANPFAPAPSLDAKKRSNPFSEGQDVPPPHG